MNNVTRLIIALLLVQQVVKTSENIINPQEHSTVVIGKTSYNVIHCGDHKYQFNLPKHDNNPDDIIDSYTVKGFELTEILQNHQLIQSLQHEL